MFRIQFWQFWGQQKFPFLANRVHQSCQKWQMPLMAKLFECKIGATFSKKMLEYSHEKVVAFTCSYHDNRDVHFQANFEVPATCTWSVNWRGSHGILYYAYYCTAWLSGIEMLGCMYNEFGFPLMYIVHNVH